MKFVYPGPAFNVSCHNHSSWSDGASPLEEVCRKGKEMGLKVLGMSDHYVLPPGEGYDSETWSMRLSRLEEYISVLQKMKNELEDDTFSLKIGLEVDFFFENIDELLAKIKTRTNEEIERYNQLAIKAAKEEGVCVGEMYEVVSRFGEECYKDYAHLKDEYCKRLGAYVASVIKSCIQ